ncbi:MAG: hypothetical protein WC322_04905 [Candidatus Paceibacterota bacterium]
MPFPTNETELVAAGYRFDRTAACRGCGAQIEWWQTPKGKWMPLDPGTMQPHWGTCPQAGQFRKGAKND